MAKFKSFNFKQLKFTSWELVVVCIILACVVMRPGWLVQLNQTLIGKILLLVGLVVASLHKPYMGLLVLLLIVSIGYYREGLESPPPGHLAGPLAAGLSSPAGGHPHDDEHPVACNSYPDDTTCGKHKNCTWKDTSCAEKK
jgi:hypothetical protein